MLSFVARALSVALAALIFVPSVALAFPTYPGIWSTANPDSQTDDNVISGTGTACQLCHAGTGGGQPWNAYGWSIRVERQLGATIQQAIANVETGDADGAGGSNLNEIDAGTQPGWTTGPVNTHFFASGATVTNQNPPAAIAGALDPAAPVPALGLLAQLLLAALATVGGVTAVRSRANA